MFPTLVFDELFVQSGTRVLGLLLAARGISLTLRILLCSPCWCQLDACRMSDKDVAQHTQEAERQNVKCLALFLFLLVFSNRQNI